MSNTSRGAGPRCDQNLGFQNIEIIIHIYIVDTVDTLKLLNELLFFCDHLATRLYTLLGNFMEDLLGTILGFKQETEKQ